ncbi:MAG: hypothetical protein KJ749_05035, partial [Planctomycetes bacterium]|nr:hypothetical protein [Planctomycetota bacterium]
ERMLADRRSSLGQLDQTIAEMEAALASAKQRVEQTRAARDELRAAGQDFADPNGTQAFAERYLALDQAHRTALREVSALQVGSLPFAEIDRTGDFVTGKYTENGSTANFTQRYGVEHYYGERRTVLAEIAVGDDALVDLRAAVERLAGLKASFQTDQDRAARQIPAARTSAAQAFDELNEIVAVAHDLEEDALQLFADAGASARQAAAGAQEAMSRAQQQTQDLPPEATERSVYGKRQQDRWIGGHISAQVADTHLARAWVYLQRYYGYQQNAELLARVAGPLQLGDVDLAGERALSTEAHDAGVEEVNQAMAALERAHSDAGRHWTFVAQEAGATYLMALFGHPGYVEDAVTAYRNAIRGREDDSASSPFAARLDYLQNR